MPSGQDGLADIEKNLEADSKYFWLILCIVSRVIIEGRGNSVIVYIEIVPLFLRIRISILFRCLQEISSWLMPLLETVNPAEEKEKKEKKKKKKKDKKKDKDQDKKKKSKNLHYAAGIVCIFSKAHMLL